MAAVTLQDVGTPNLLPHSEMQKCFGNSEVELKNKDNNAHAEKQTQM